MSELKLVRSRLLQKIFEVTRSAEIPLADICARMEAGEDLLGLARELDLIDEQSETHFRNDWFAASGYWGDCNVEGIIRRGFIAAFRMAESLNVPIAGYWLSGAAELSVLALPSPVQLSLLILTPPFESLHEEGHAEHLFLGVEIDVPGIHAKG